MTTLTHILTGLASLALFLVSPLLWFVLDTPSQPARRTRSTKADAFARELAELRAERAATERRLAELSV